MNAPTLSTLALILTTSLALGCEAGSRSDAPDREAAALDREAVDRGSYLVEGLLQCFDCHSERDWSQPGAPVTGAPGAGRVYLQDGAYPLVAMNLTPDEETGIGLWTDEDLERAIRRGIGHDGRPLSSAMPFEYFRHLTDGDVAAVIAYLRSRDPVRNELPRSALSPERRSSLERRPPTTLDPADLSSSDSVELGRRLVRLSRCQGCHTAWEAPRNPGVFGGGNTVNLGQSPADGGEPRGVLSTNLTPHVSGLSYDVETFIVFMKTGKGGTLDGAMPWTVLRNVGDADLRAIYAFLQTMHPVAHYVNNVDEPTYCAVCGQIHGLGELNRPYDPPAKIAMDPAGLERYGGVYYSERWNWTIRISVVGGRLLAQTAEGRAVGREAPLMDVVMLSDTRLTIPDEGVLEVLFGADGAVTRLVTVDVDQDVFERIE